MTTEPVDVIIVGAGLAGAAAASALARHGLRVVVLEARTRVGGRGHARSFGGDVLDFGGSWITPWHARIRSLCQEHGISLRPRTPIVERRWYRDGGLHLDGPTAPADRARHERSIARMAVDSILLKKGHSTDETGRDIAGLSFADYLDRLDAPQATRDLLGAWWTVSGNADKSRAPAAEILASAAYGGGLAEAMIDAWSDSLVGGVEALVEAILAACRVSVVRDAVVVGVDCGTDVVRVRLADERILEGRAAVLATGLNPLRSIAFSPSLPSAKSTAAGLGHLGRAVKIWARARGVPVGVLVTGGGQGIEWMMSERLAADGATLIVGFGVATADWTPDFPRDGERAVKRFFPEADAISIDWHDWNTDPFSLGAWVAGIVGSAEAHAYETWRRHGRLAFATSDFAPEHAGWFEAAAISGEAAAGEILEALGRNDWGSGGPGR